MDDKKFKKLKNNFIDKVFDYYYNCLIEDDKKPKLIYGWMDSEGHKYPVAIVVEQSLRTLYIIVSEEFGFEYCDETKERTSLSYGGLFPSYDIIKKELFGGH
jgi:hypothetical protein